MHCSRTPISATPVDRTGFEGDGTRSWRRILRPHPEEAAKQQCRRMGAAMLRDARMQVGFTRLARFRVYPTCTLKAPISGKPGDRCVLLSMRTGHDMSALERLGSHVAGSASERHS